MVSSDFSSSILRDFTFRLIISVTAVLFHRLDETSPVLSSAFTTSRSPYAEGFLTAAFPKSVDLIRFFAASIAFAMRDRLGSLFFPLSGLTCRRCKFHFMLRAAVLLPFPWGDTTLQHSQSPGCTGCLLPSRLTVTRIGLSPTSRR